MKWLSKKLFYILGLTLLCITTEAQSLADAKKMYDEKQYAEALPVFEKLVKQSPSNASYNLWYGVCCYETGDLANAEKHLKVAVKRKTPEAYPYMADIYQKTYQFDEAADVLDDYIALLSKKKQDTEAAEELLDRATDARRLMERVEDVQIIDSMVVNKNDFLSVYVLSEESGSLQPFQQFFNSRKPVYSSVYMNQKGDKIYYALPADSGQYALYNQSRLMDDWGDEEQTLIGTDETADENFPFMLSDGVTLYFSSTGNGSIGGYDLFATRYNINSNAYLAPEQLGMPFNSPYNDYMLVIDEVKNLGWFVSDRFQPEGKVCVYLFIPNPDRKRVESEDIAYKRSRAMISSIEESWKPDTDYAALIRLSRQEIPYGNKQKDREFVFIVNDDQTYYKLNEIKSPEARSFYEKVLATGRQIQTVENRLDDMRTSYGKASGAQKQQLTSSILQTESQLSELREQLKQMEKRARNAEILYMNKRK